MDGDGRGLAGLEFRRDAHEEEGDDGQRHGVQRHEESPDVLLDALLDGHVADADTVEVGTQGGTQVDVLDVDGEGQNHADGSHPHGDDAQACREPRLEWMKDESVSAKQFEWNTHQKAKKENTTLDTKNKLREI